MTAAQGQPLVFLQRKQQVKEKPRSTSFIELRKQELLSFPFSLTLEEDELYE